MLIKKGQKLKIKHSRKGQFTGEASKDFNTEKSEYWPIVSCDYVEGLDTNWRPGERIPCRACLIISWKIHE